MFFFQCYEVRGIHDFRVKKILDSLLQALGISAEGLDPNVVMERTLQIVSENEEVDIYHAVAQPVSMNNVLLSFIKT